MTVYSSERLAGDTAGRSDLRADPLRQVLGRIGDTWTILVIEALYDGPQRYTDLSRNITGISQKMLTRTLRALQRDGFVSREVHAVVPPRVEYQLTELGQSLRAPIAALEEWSVRYRLDILAARAEFDRESQ